MVGGSTDWEKEMGGGVAECGIHEFLRGGLYPPRGGHRVSLVRRQLRRLCLKQSPRFWELGEELGTSGYEWMCLPTWQEVLIRPGKFHIRLGLEV